MKLTDSLLSVKGFGPSTYLKLSKNGFSSVASLLQYFPIRYEDYSEKSFIALMQENETLTIKAKVKNFKNQITRKRNFNIQTLLVEDKSGEIEIVWFNQPYIVYAFKKEQEYFFSGKVNTFGNKLNFMAQEYEPATNKPPVHTGRIVPYYSSSLKISSKVLRQRILAILNLLDENSIKNDFLSKTDKNGLLTSFETLFNLHFPKNLAMLKKAQYRLKLEQLFVLKLKQLKRQNFREKRTTPNIKVSALQQAQFIKNLPFELTNSQTKVISQINQDLSKGHMDRLLMGDVGSGKTVLMSYSSLVTGQNNYQTLVMAPTEGLAEQHFSSFKSHLQFSNLKIGLLTSKYKPDDLGKLDIIIGTQALLFSKTKFGRLGLVIVDEQHKFGVEQREVLLANPKILPYFLTVSATPIPRSLALTLYGNIEISYLKEKPNIDKLKTYLVPENKRQDALNWINKRVLKYQTQAYVVCAAAEDKDETKNELKTVENEEKKLKKLFPNLRIAGIYSKHPKKQEILTQFRNHSLDILVSTSLIEVGIDIGNADIMVVENSDRFGLSQLHQLRGRIGRRGKPAFCFLFTDSSSQSIMSRLKVLTQSNDGLKIATEDLKLRGPGNLLGIEQHGFSYLRVSDLLDSSLITRVNKITKLILDKSLSLDYTSILISS